MSRRGGKEEKKNFVSLEKDLGVGIFFTGAAIQIWKKGENGIQIWKRGRIGIKMGPSRMRGHSAN